VSTFSGLLLAVCMFPCPGRFAFSSKYPLYWFPDLFVFWCTLLELILQGKFILSSKNRLKIEEITILINKSATLEQDRSIPQQTFKPLTTTDEPEGQHVEIGGKTRKLKRKSSKRKSSKRKSSKRKSSKKRD
jgi:hypothetical protein